jgi:hypothetical protein
VFNGLFNRRAGQRLYELARRRLNTRYNGERWRAVRCRSGRVIRGR